MSNKTRLKRPGESVMLSAITPLPPRVNPLRIWPQRSKLKSRSENLSKQGNSWVSVTPLLVVILAGLFPWIFLANPAGRFGDFENIFLGLTIEALPFLLMGGLVAAGLNGWKRRSQKAAFFWKRLTGNRVGAAAAGVGLGFALPVCECGTASIARQVSREGAPVSMSLGFLLAAPIVNPVTILVTWLAFNGDWFMVLSRVGLGLGLAVGLGLFFSLHPRPGEMFKPGVLIDKDFEEVKLATEHSHENDEACHLAHEKAEGTYNQPGMVLFLNRAFSEFIQSTRVALPGIALASAFQAYISPRFFLEFGQGALLSTAVLMILATLMSVCSSVDAFVALSFTGLFPTGSVLAFLVFGPLINLKSLFLFRLVLRPSIIWLMALMCFQFILLAGVLINLWLF